MAPRRKKSQTSDLAQDAEKRLDATTGPAQDGDLPEGPVPADEAVIPEPMASDNSDGAPSEGADSLTLSAKADDVPAMAEQPVVPEVKAEPQEERIEPSLTAAPTPDAPKVEAVRPLAGDRPRPSARPRRRGKALLLLIAAVAGAGIAFSGVLPAFFTNSGSRSGEGYNPPPKLSDVRDGQVAAVASDPRPVTRASTENEDAAALSKLREDLSRADSRRGEEVQGLTKRLDDLEKRQNTRIADLTKRLEAAEARLNSASSNSAAAASPQETPTASAPPRTITTTPSTGQDMTGTVPADGASDPVIASTDATANPLPLPRPSDLGQRAASEPGQISVVRPQESRAGDTSSSPVLRSWILRDVYDGVALIEGRYGMIEVVEGSVLPGGGVVQNIRRAGGRWIVTTNRGIIANR